MVKVLKGGKSMKLIFAIIQEADVRGLLSRLIDKGYKATKLASTGGFLKARNTTLLIGVEEEKVENALRIIKENGRKRTNIRSYTSYLSVLMGRNIHMDPV